MTVLLCQHGITPVAVQLRVGKQSRRRLSLGTRSSRQSQRCRVRNSVVVYAQEGGDEERYTVAVTGATGFLGSRVTAALLQQGHSVRVLTRSVADARRRLPLPAGSRLQFYAPEAWGQGVQGATHCVNLAGEPISTRWTPDIKRAILTSRLGATERLVAAMAACPPEQRPRALLSASAIGFYGTSVLDRFTEDSAAGPSAAGDYLAEVCRRWEAAAAAAAPLGARVVVLRMGIILDGSGGALSMMAPIFQGFAGGPLGDGRQWFSWIHRDDAVAVLLRLLADGSLAGPVNVVAPRPVRFRELCTALGACLGRPSWLPVPEFAIQALLGEGAKVVLEGQFVTSSRLAALKGFKFQYGTLDAALRRIYR